MGKVTLVGAGPGDPDLITVKGLAALRKADVVLYDRLVPWELLNEVGKNTECVFVGKKGGHYGFPQEETHRLMRRRAEEGLSVVRLKGGDPFLFGRGAEEIEYLVRVGVETEVIPGVTSALAVPASLGIPLTHRGMASSVAIVSGHQIDEPSNPINWKQLAVSVDTLVVLMPLKNLRQIICRLLSFGRSLDTPACLIQEGTTKYQQQIVGRLRDLADRVESAGFGSPSILVVGEVVSLADSAVSASSSRLAEKKEPFEKTGA